MIGPGPAGFGLSAADFGCFGGSGAVRAYKLPGMFGLRVSSLE